jgi:hypothetical protein
MIDVIGVNHKVNDGWKVIGVRVCVKVRRSCHIAVPKRDEALELLNNGLHASVAAAIAS